MYRQVLLSNGTETGKEHGIPIEPDNPNLDDPMIVKFSDGTQVAATCLTVKQYRERHGSEPSKTDRLVTYQDVAGKSVILQLVEQNRSGGPSSTIWMIKHLDGSPSPQVTQMTKNRSWDKATVRAVQIFMYDITQQYAEGFVDKDGTKDAKKHS